MRTTDILQMALTNSRQQKTRTVLCLLGVVTGSLFLQLSLAAQRGVQDAVERVFNKNDRLRRIQVWPRYGVDEKKIPSKSLQVHGDMDEAKRKRIRKMLIRKWEQEHYREIIGLTDKRLEKIKSFAHVERVLPTVRERCRAEFQSVEPSTKESVKAICLGVTSTNEVLAERMVAGEVFSSDNAQSVVVHEFLAYLWGYRSADELKHLAGRMLRVEFVHAEEVLAGAIAFRSGQSLEFSPEETKLLNELLDRMPEWAGQLPLSQAQRAVLKKAFSTKSPSDENGRVEFQIRKDFRICGVFRGPNEEEEKSGRRMDDLFGGGEILLPLETAAEISLRLPRRAEFGFDHATVVVDDQSNLKTVNERIMSLDLQTHTLITLVEYIQQQVRTVTWVLTGFAAAAIFLSGLGITNTMVMSVVERTHEIGVMKAIGARDRQILGLFLCEGALLGLLGAGAALLLALGLWLPLDHYARSILESELNERFTGEHVIVFPPLLLVAVPVFAVSITTLASIIPARRAARIDPVEALRHV